MFSRVIDRIIAWLASPPVITVATALIVLDGVYGLYLRLNGAWGSVNGAWTGLASMVLFLLVLHGQMRGEAAIHLKLDAIIANDENLPNRLVASEDRPAVELQRMKEEALEQVKDTVEEVVQDA